jgi:DNA-binding Lrp family transcriptional regulator
MKLDDIDKQILNQLYRNGRESLTSLNQKIYKTDKGIMSHTGVKKRILKLENSNVLKVQGNINLNNINYKACFILLEMRNYDEIRKIIECYKDCPRVFLLTHITGQYNILMGIVGQNIDVLHRYINYCGPTNKEGVLHSQILFISTIESPKFLPINLFSKESQENKCGNICKDCEAFIDGECDGCGNF